MNCYNGYFLSVYLCLIFLSSLPFPPLIIRLLFLPSFSTPPHTHTESQYIHKHTHTLCYMMTHEAK